MRALALLALCVPTLAEADGLGSWKAAAWMHYELSAVHGVDRTGEAEPPSELVLAGARLHAIAGKNRTIGVHLAFDFAFGSTLRGAGFAYDVALLPLGIGVRIGTTGVLALGTGFQASGAVGTLDDAVALPVEAIAELGGGRLRVLARVRASWIAGADGRQSGAPSATFADELDAMLALRIGRHYDEGYPDLTSGNGYFIGAAYRELAGTRFAGLVVGYGLDLATR